VMRQLRFEVKNADNT